jgi:hypothetical protein
MDDDHEGKEQGDQAPQSEETPPFNPDRRLIGYLERAPRHDKDRNARDADRK